jgi:hypothetical protein
MRESPERPAPVIDRNAARQGVRGHGVWIVLAGSLFLALIAWGLIEAFVR